MDEIIKEILSEPIDTYRGYDHDKHKEIISDNETSEISNSKESVQIQTVIPLEPQGESLLQPQEETYLFHPEESDGDHSVGGSSTSSKARLPSSTLPIIRKASEPGTMKEIERHSVRDTHFAQSERKKSSISSGNSVVQSSSLHKSSRNDEAGTEFEEIDMLAYMLDWENAMQNSKSTQCGHFDTVDVAVQFTGMTATELIESKAVKDRDKSSQVRESDFESRMEFYLENIFKGFVLRSRRFVPQANIDVLSADRFNNVRTNRRRDAVTRYG